MKKKERKESILKLLEGITAYEAQQTLLQVSKEVQKKSIYKPVTWLGMINALVNQF